MCLCLACSLSFNITALNVERRRPGVDTATRDTQQIQQWTVNGGLLVDAHDERKRIVIVFPSNVANATENRNLHKARFTFNRIIAQARSTENPPLHLRSGRTRGKRPSLSSCHYCPLSQQRNDGGRCFSAERRTIAFIINYLHQIFASTAIFAYNIFAHGTACLNTNTHHTKHPHSTYPINMWPGLRSLDGGATCSPKHHQLISRLANYLRTVALVRIATARALALGLVSVPLCVSHTL